MNTDVPVTLKKSKFESDKLILTVIDSQATTAEISIEVQILSDGSLQIGGKMDQLCLGNNSCYFLTL